MDLNIVSVVEARVVIDLRGLDRVSLVTNLPPALETDDDPLWFNFEAPSVEC